MNEQENIALVKKLYDAFAKGDIKTILAHLSDDVKWSSPGPDTIPYSGDKTGPTEVREFFSELVGTQENVNLTIDQFVAQGDAVATLGRYSGNVKATGEPFDSVVGHFFTIRAGKVSRWIGLADTAHAAAAYTRASAAAPE
ncbi:MAG: nuclear transport factor 2 family protein [Bryobacteraceae bacterium]